MPRNRCLLEGPVPEASRRRSCTLRHHRMSGPVARGRGRHRRTAAARRGSSALSPVLRRRRRPPRAALGQARVAHQAPRRMRRTRGRGRGARSGRRRGLAWAKRHSRRRTRSARAIGFAGRTPGVIEVKGIVESPVARLTPQHDKAILVLDGQPTQEQCLSHREDRGRQTDAQSERDNRDSDEPWSAAKASKSVTEVLEYHIHASTRLEQGLRSQSRKRSLSRPASRRQPLHPPPLPPPSPSHTGSDRAAGSPAPARTRSSSGTTRYPPQCGGSGTSPSAKRASTSRRSASSAARPGITWLWCDAQAPSRLPSGRLLK